MPDNTSMPTSWDSSGRRISLLNDDPARSNSGRQYQSHSAYGAPEMIRSNSNNSSPSSTGSPPTPDLMRSNSYDSQRTLEPRSPITPDSPNSMVAGGRSTSFMSLGGTFKDAMQHQQYEQRAQFDYSSQPQYRMTSGQDYGESRSTPYTPTQVYDEDSYANHGALSPHITERGHKRYPCRFANEFNCDKTFTTSGHASRHSKIHTAEKAVHCSYEGCPKKFTRADNMKQHLETHFKERSRTSTGGRPPATRPGPQVLTKPSGIRKTGYPSSNQGSRSNSVAELPPISILDPALLGSAVQQSAASPCSPLSMGPGFKQALESRPVPGRSGLDALALAAEFS